MHKFINIVKNKTTLRKVIARPISIQFKGEFSVDLYKPSSEQTV